VWTVDATDPLTEADLTDAEILALQAATRLMVEALDNDARL
jgi:hypothetical protein